MGLFSIGKKAVELAGDTTGAVAGAVKDGAEKTGGILKKMGQKLGGLGGIIKKAVFAAGAISLVKGGYDVYQEMHNDGKSFTEAMATPTVHQATEASARDAANGTTRQLAPEPTGSVSGTESQPTM